MRNSEDILGSAMMPYKNSSGDFAAAAASAAFLSAVFLFGVPRWRPPRLSPGFDPLGIACSLPFVVFQITKKIQTMPLIGAREVHPPEAGRKGSRRSCGISSCRILGRCAGDLQTGYLRG